MKNVVLSLWRLLISLKFAVVIMTGLTVAMIVATVLESAYDTPTALYWVYRTTWFYLLLGALGVNILVVALSRLPWQPKHLPFLLAHLGILILLWGSWLTYRYGLDAQMMATEGARERAVELSEHLLRLVEGSSVKTVRIPWIPPHVEFKPMHVPEAGLIVKEFISHADPKLEFVPAASPGEGFPAIKVKIAGGPKAPPFMRAGQEFWLWLGDPSWTQSQAGGAQVYLRQDAAEIALPLESAGLGLNWLPGKKRLQVTSRATGAKEVKTFNLDEASLQGAVVDPGWKFEVRMTVLEFIPNARSEVSYQPSQTQYGQQAPPSAILLEAVDGGGQRSAPVWLGLGERASLETGGKKILLSYSSQRVSLPFEIELKRFQIEHYEGTANPMEFSSIVTVHDEQPDPNEPVPVDHVISMNEPLKYGGYTFYQASYVPGEPRPVTSIFSVNQDPGRWVKHVGSILICLGSILLFVMKNRRRRKGKPA